MVVHPQPVQPDPAATAQIRPSEAVIVLGAGIAGISAADRLARAGCAVTVIDASPRIGGAHRSTEIGPYTFDAGSIFYEEEAAIFSLLPSLRETCPAVRRVQRRIAPDGSLRHYPLEPRDLLAWPRARLARIAAEMATGRLRHRDDGTLRAAMNRRLGRALPAWTGLDHYAMRFNRMAPERIDAAFFVDRMAFVERRTRWRALAAWGWGLARPPAPAPRAPLRVRPAEGFDRVWTPMRAALEARGVRFALGRPVEAVTISDSGACVTAGGETFRAARAVGAMPIDALHRAATGTPSGLRALDLMTLFVSAGALHEGAGNVLFNFHAEGRWKRATVYSRLYPERRGARDFMAVEITLPPGAAPDPEAAFADTARHLGALGLAGDLRLEGVDVIESAYPLYELGFAATRDAAIARIVAAGVIPVGRQGRFDYLPTSSGVIRRTLSQLDRAGLPTPASPA